MTSIRTCSTQVRLRQTEHFVAERKAHLPSPAWPLGSSAARLAGRALAGGPHATSFQGLEAQVLRLGHDLFGSALNAAN